MCAVGYYEVRSDVSVTRNTRELPSPAERHFCTDEGGTRSAARTRSSAMWVPTLQQASVTSPPSAPPSFPSTRPCYMTLQPVTRSHVLVSVMSGNAISGTNIFGITADGVISKPTKPGSYCTTDKSLARPGRKQATTTDDFDVNISYL